MATAVIMPKSGQSVESCILTEWHKKPGDGVQEGDLLFSYETDKASFEESAKVSGILLTVFFQADDDVPCLANVAVIGQAGEDIKAFAPNGGASTPASTPAASSPTAVPVMTSAVEEKTSPAPEASTPLAVPVYSEQESENSPSNVEIIASPRAKATAARLGLSLDTIKGTGPHGRILEEDVLGIQRPDSPRKEETALAAAPEKAISSIPAAPADIAWHDEKLPNIRKIIARSMHQSLMNTAQLTNQAAFDATAILRLRKELKAMSDTLGLPNITINDMLLYACAHVLPRHKYLNAHFLDDRIRCFDHVHLGMAVDTPRGLLVPTLFDADQKSLKEIAMESKALAAQAQSGSIHPDLLTGATFTISNLGALGTEFFTPILNPPQTGILGIGCTVERVRMENGSMTTFPAMGLSLTYDHRAVDGAPAARFLQELMHTLENFSSLLVQ